MDEPQQQARVSLGDLLPAGMTIVVLAVTLAVGAKVLGTIRTDTVTCDTGLGYNISSGLCENVYGYDISFGFLWFV